MSTRQTALYYFSGTGNTLMLARLLAQELGDTEIVNIAGCRDSATAPEADRVGILFPVYAFGLPRIVHNFVKNSLETAENTYVFSLANYGGGGGPAALKQLEWLLKGNRGKLDAGFGLTMPSNYLPFGGAESQERQNRRFIAAAEKIKEIARIIEKRPENYFYRKSFVPGCIARRFNKYFCRSFAREAAKFYVNRNCTACGVCEQICPTQNVKLVDGRPRWGDNCEQCFACLQWCPAVAIHRRGIPETRQHYHNPTVTAQDLIKDIRK
ncbi:MAG: EFR1 family ferrodoxin [Victivallaceae bacterium]|nr:EFR1 family ferrodoxin [Victivallaceae bacterium]